MTSLLQGTKLGALLMRGTRGELIRGVGVSLLLRGAGAALSLAVSIVLARLLGAEGFGVYAYCLAIVSLLAIPSQFGAGTVLVRFVAAYERQRQWGLVRGLLSWANQFVLASSVVLAAITAVVFIGYPGLMPSGEASTLWLALVLLPVLALGELRAAALRGFRRFAKGQLPEMILRPGGLLLIVFLMTAFSFPLGPRDAMLAYIVACLIAFGFGVWWLWRAVPAQSWASNPERETGKWARAMGVLSLTQGGRVALSRVDLVFVGSLAGAEAAGVYRVATSLVGLVGFTLSAFNSVVGPYFSGFHVNDQHDRIKRLMLASAVAAGGFAVPIVLALYFWGEALIQIIYGADFVYAYVPLLILCVGQLVNAATGTVGTLTSMIGRERWALVAVATSLAVAIPGYLYAVPKMGAIGAAAVTASALILLNSILVVRLSLWLFFKRKELSPKA